MAPIISACEEIIDKAIAIIKKKAIDGYEIYFHQSSNFNVESKEGKIDTLITSKSWAIAIRVLTNGRMGFSYLTSLDPSIQFRGLEGAIDDAFSSAKVIPNDPCYDFAPKLQNIPTSPPIFDPSMSEISEREKIGKARSLEHSVRSVDPRRIKKVRKASYGDAISRTTLINSNGLEFSYDSTLASISVIAVAEEAGESEMGWDFDFSHFWGELDEETIGKSAGQKALEMLGGRRIPSGIYSVILINDVAAEFLSLLAHSFSAEQVQKGKSLLKDRRGEKVFSSIISIIDDGLLPRGLSTSPVDGEGMPAQKTPLVINGELITYLYDIYWSNREKLLTVGLNVESTGNSARHSIKSPPHLGISNLFINSGEVPFLKLLEGLNRGLLITEVMGLHTVDPISGDFSLGCSGQWIEGGKKVHPVKSIAMAGNLIQLFKRVQAIGEDLKFIGSVGSPSLLIEGVEISGD